MVLCGGERADTQKSDKEGIPTKKYNNEPFQGNI
jgi:hypothetical protein